MADGAISTAAHEATPAYAIFAFSVDLKTPIVRAEPSLTALDARINYVTPCAFGREAPEGINMQILYRAKATASGAGRAGHTRSDDGKVDFQLSIPKEMGGPGGEGTNPEQLFAAGYAACFLSALQLVSRETKVALSPDTAITIQVGLGPNEKGEGYNLDIDLTVSGTGLDIDSAQEVLEHAHRVCPYSNATRGNVEVRLSVEP